MADVTFKPATELAQQIRDRQIGHLELLDHYLERVRRFNPQLNAIVVQDAGRARDRARQADAALARGEVWGPLHGVPMTCKESFNVAGLPTTFGAPELKDNVAAEDALAIQWLKAAGAIVFGKTNVPLWLADFQSYNDVYGTTNNPWDLQRGPGGSSGGSAAALASGMTALEIGSDIGGSIRNPAHFCGVFGHKPTWGLLPSRGHTASRLLAESDLSVIGPLARSAADLELSVHATAGPDELQRAGYRLDLQAPSQTSLADYRVAVWKNDDVAPVSQEVVGKVEAVVEAISRSGGTVDETAQVDGVSQPYFQQTFWAGLANCAYLPSTVVPAGLSADGLPIGVQIIGPEFGDLKTIGLARLLEDAGFSFTPPAGY